MTRKKKRRFRTTSQVPELKKSWMLLKALPTITRGSFRSSTPQETRARRSRRERTPRTRRRSACRQRSPSYALILGQIGQEVKGAGDEERPAEGARLHERGHRVLHLVDLGEEGSRPLRQVGR